MKVISLYQPYATLIVLGLKQFETRSWNTKYRGSLAIHATQGYPGWAKALVAEKEFREPLLEKGVVAFDLDKVRGHIIGTVELVDTLPTDKWVGDRLKSPGVIHGEYWHEYCYGDYSPGRYAWQLKNPVLFDQPIPAKGSQGFWQFDVQLAQHPQYKHF